MKCLWIAVIVALMGVVASGCRCGGPSEKDLPFTEPSSRSNPLQATCPSRPAWAGKLEKDVELELLHVREQGKKVLGTGYRLHEDRGFETYDTIAIEPDDAGRMVFKVAEGRWEDRGKVEEQAVQELRKAIAEHDPKDLEGRWRTTGGATAWTLLITRHDGGFREMCYVGTEAPGSIQGLEKQIHDLMARRKE